MEISRNKAALILLEGYIVHLIVYAVGGYYLAPQIEWTFHDLPSSTASMLFSSILSQVGGILYLLFRLSCFPSFMVNKHCLKDAAAGFIAIWLIIFLNLLMFGEEHSLVRKSLSVQGNYVYLNIAIVVILGPVLEEVLYRGYILKTLARFWSNNSAVLISTILFVITHAIWTFRNYPDVLSLIISAKIGLGLIFIFLYSLVYSYSYLICGLPISILLHVFTNSFLFYLAASSNSVAHN
jgi:membrane protease YdiL (CAAX protease family)